jgi:hypothetical protein
MSRVAQVFRGSPVMDDKESTSNDVDEYHRASSIATLLRIVLTVDQDN